MKETFRTHTGKAFQDSLSKGPIGHIKEKTSSNHSRTYSKRLKTGTGKDF
jgi:hypothetical protein